MVDDDRGCRELVVDVLSRAGFETRAAGTPEQIRALLELDAAAAAVVDVELPGTSGYEVCRALRERFGPQLPVMLISGVRPEPYDRVAGLELGADDYLAKPFDPDELAARVRALVRRSRLGSAPNRDGAALEDLTEREWEVLGLLADGLDQTQIAAELVISPKTVATHIQRMLGKLGVHSRAQAVALALRSPERPPDNVVRR